MEIKVFGPGCAKCAKLYQNAQDAVKELGSDAKVEKVSDMNEIMKHGIMMVPGLVIDGTVKSVGKVPSVEEIKNMIG